MIDTTTLLADITSELQPSTIKDYCPNGLQVEGTSTIRTLITGVTASEQFLEATLAFQPDAILVHHGLFWHKQDQQVTGALRRKLALLLNHNINLLAYHLPLDVHCTLGNNAALGTLLGFMNCEPVSCVKPHGILWCGQLVITDTDGSTLAHTLRTQLHHAPLHITANRPIQTVAWCTGAAQHFIKEAYELGMDAFISGEISEQTVHFAHEHQMHYYAAGHYATERGGVQALGQKLATQFDMQHHFVDLPVPV